jgi:hypothetical protein
MWRHTRRAKELRAKGMKHQEEEEEEDEEAGGIV